MRAFRDVGGTLGEIFHVDADGIEVPIDVSALADGAMIQWDAGLSAWVLLDPAGFFVLAVEKGVAGGVATLDGSGKIPSGQIPAIALVKVVVVANQAARLALTAQQGDVAVQADTSRAYMLKEGGDPSVNADWIELTAFGGGSSAARANAVITTASLANLASENGTVTMGKSGYALKISADRHCRATFYKTAAARTADAGRDIGTDPELGAGVIADFVFDATSGLTIDAQSMLYGNTEGSPSDTIAYRIQNRSGSSSAVEVTLTHVPVEP